jgi:uncharacterized protein YjbI with pentapeptide repeats
MSDGWRIVLLYGLVLAEQGGFSVRRVLYRFYLSMMKANIDLRQWLYVSYLSRRKHELASADLSYLNLQGANLRKANLRETNLRRCDLTGVDFTGADLSGADLTAARVTDEQLARAASLAGATLPDGTIQI